MDVNQSILNLSQIYVNITFLEGLKILSLSTIYGFFIRQIFIKFSNSLSSKIGFGNTILLVMISTASLIAVVKSSLALSLGLVGALSVIRFRSAIKEPYNLAFILFAICTSIAIGASQFRFATLIVIFGSLTIYSLFKFKNGINSSLIIERLDTITIEFMNEVDMKKIYLLLDKNLVNYKLQSFSEISNNVNISIRCTINDVYKLEKLRKEIKLISKDFELNFYESPNL